jgi:type III secretory pathway component EscT
MEEKNIGITGSIYYTFDLLPFFQMGGILKLLPFD